MILKQISKLYHSEVSGIGLAIFRILFGINLILELCHSWYFQDIIFSSAVSLPLGLWIISLIFVTFGLFTRPATIINYLLCTSVIYLQDFHYHVDYAYYSISFLIMFMPISRCLSLDRLILKLKYSNIRKDYIPPITVSKLNYMIPLFLGAGLLYFESAVNWKILSPVWMKGLGMWLPASTPYLIHFKMQSILNFKWLMLFLGYLTIVFEILFVFLFWFKRFRFLFFLIGLGLHIGILVFFPIPLFATGMLVYFVLLLPVGYWVKLSNMSIFSPTKRLLFFYDKECPLCMRTRIVLNHLDFFNNIEFLSVQDNASKYEVLLREDPEALLNDIYSIDAKGNLYKGVDTYIKAFFAMRYLIPLALFISIPGIYHLGKKVYSFIARNRYVERCTEENCNIPEYRVPQDIESMSIFKNFSLSDLKIRIIVTFLGFAIVLQLILSMNSGLMFRTAEALGISTNTIVHRTAKAIYPFAKTFLGLGSHAVYMDYAYYGYSLKIEYQYPDGSIERLPIIKEDGTSDIYMYGPNYVFYLFGCINQNRTDENNDLTSTLSQEALEKELPRWLDFWLDKKGITELDGNFQIEIKDFGVYQEWEKDALTKSLETPWANFAKISYSNGCGYNFNYTEIGQKYLETRITNDL